MKAVLSGKQTRVYARTSDGRFTPKSHSKLSITSVSKRLRKQDSSIGSRVLDSSTKCKSAPSLRKRGRPPKAGPSKKFKPIKNVAEMYKGKLSNLVRSPGMGRLDDSFSDGDCLF